MAQQTAAEQSQSLPSPPDRSVDMLRLVSDAAHELVGPVNQLSSLVALFVNRYRDQLDDDASDLLGHVQAAGARTATVANGLRTYFRVISSPYGRSRVNTRAVIDSAMAELKLEIEDSQAEIDVGPMSDVEGDANLLSQVFQAVVRNSLKACRPDTPLRVVISCRSTSTGCLISVADNGIGIDPAYSESVFRAFTKLTGHSTPGAGMGLTIAQAIVNLHGGRIWVGKQVPPGTTVFIELPEAGS
jgi:light-regulated signal transduction histidine kinase (bacteriophytochrome)